MKRTAKHKGRGFTLVELITAATITLVLAGLLISITANLLEGWNRARGSVATGNYAKFVMDRIAADLESAIIRADGNVWLAATIQPDQSGSGDSGASIARWSPTSGGAVKPNAFASPTPSLHVEPGDEDRPVELRKLEEFRFGMAGVWLRFLTIEPDSGSNLQNTSAPRAVSYQILRFRAGGSGAPIRYGLFRSWVRPFDSDSPRSSFAVGYDLFSDGDAFPHYNNPDYADGNSATGDPGSVRRASLNDLIADNVIDFGVRLWARNVDGELAVLFPKSDDNCGFAATTNTSALPPSSPWSPVLGATMSYGFPEVAEVFIRVLTDEGVALIEAVESGKASGDWWELALANSRVYTRRVEIHARAL